MTATDCWYLFKWAVEGGHYRDRMSNYKRHKYHGIGIKPYVELLATAILRCWAPPAPTRAQVYDCSSVTDGDKEVDEGDELDSIIMVPNPNPPKDQKPRASLLLTQGTVAPAVITRWLGMTL